MRSIVSVSPFRCRMWELHDRLDEHISEITCRTEIESFQQHGQLVPVLGRPLQHRDWDVELIVGARRLFVARHVNKPLLVDLRELSDREAIVAMDIENRQRIDISPYERGLSYARWLRSGHFQSQEELGRSLKVSASQVSRLLKLSRLPSALVNAFGTATEICEGWGLDLLSVLEYPQQRQRILSRARLIARRTPRPPAKEVYRQLLAASVAGRRPRRGAHDRVIKGRHGTPLLRVRQQSRAIALLLAVDKVSAASLEQICTAVVDILEAVGAERSVKSGRATGLCDTTSQLPDFTAEATRRFSNNGVPQCQSLANTSRARDDVVPG